MQLELENKVDKYGVDAEISKGVLARWRKLFVMLDADESGTLDSDEIKTGFVRIGVLAHHFNMNQLFVDLEASGVIEHSDELDIYDFVQFMHVFGNRSRQLAPNSENPDEALAKLDLDDL